MTHAEFKATRAAELDAAWAAKHPEGLYYWITLHVPNLGPPQYVMGRVTKRPTARRTRYDKRSLGAYVGRGWFCAVAHHTFRTWAKFSAFLATLTPEQRQGVDPATYLKPTEN